MVLLQGRVYGSTPAFFVSVVQFSISTQEKMLMGHNDIFFRTVKKKIALHSENTLSLLRRNTRDRPIAALHTREQFRRITRPNIRFGSKDGICAVPVHNSTAHTTFFEPNNCMLGLVIGLPCRFGDWSFRCVAAKHTHGCFKSVGCSLPSSLRCWKW